MKNILSVLFIASLLAGCGYQLKGTGQAEQFSLSDFKLECSQKTAWELCATIRNNLLAAGSNLDSNAVKVLSISDIDTQERIIALESDGDAAETQIRRSLRFTVSDASTDKTIRSEEIFARSLYVNDDAALLAKNNEKRSMLKLLDQELAESLLRALQQTSIAEADYR